MTSEPTADDLARELARTRQALVRVAESALDELSMLALSLPVPATSPGEAYDAGHRDGLEEGVELPRYDVERVRAWLDHLAGTYPEGTTAATVAANLRRELGLTAE